MQVKIIELTEETKTAAEDLFIAYSHELGMDEQSDPRLTEKVLREKIFRGLFVKKWEEGALFITLAAVGGEPAGFAIYQIDAPESDWNKRPGWGFIREFYVSPRARRQGIGRALAEHAAKRLLEKTDRLYLTGDEDEGALAFWKACGYRGTGEVNENGTYTMEQIYC